MDYTNHNRTPDAAEMRRKRKKPPEVPNPVRMVDLKRQPKDWEELVKKARKVSERLSIWH